MMHGITGAMNSGKSFYMAYLLLTDLRMGRKILSNYKLNFRHYQINQDFLLDMAMRQPNIKNLSMGLDEAWLWIADSRSAGKQVNKLVSYMCLQSSKDDTNIYFTTQNIFQIDKRIYANLHRYTVCSRVIIRNGKTAYVGNDRRFLTPEHGYPAWIFDHLYIECMTFDILSRGGASVMELNPDLSINLRVKDYYKMFDTTQKMRPYKEIRREVNAPA